MKLLMLLVAVALGCGGDGPPPNPWLRRHTDADVKALVVECGRVLVTDRFSELDPHIHEAEFDINAAIPYQIKCMGQWSAKTKRMVSLHVGIVAKGQMHVTPADIAPIAEYILRELPPGPREVARRVATGPEQEVKVGPFQITGGLPNASGFWSLMVYVAD